MLYRDRRVFGVRVPVLLLPGEWTYGIVLKRRQKARSYLFAFIASNTNSFRDPH